MKKVILLVCSIGLLSGSVAMAYEWKSQDISIPKRIPQYLLLLRYWGSVMEQHGDYSTSTQGWVYLKETYDSMDEVVTRLNTYTGGGMTSFGRDNELVGLWELGDSRNIKDRLKLDEVKHQAERKVEINEWSEWKWSLKPR